MKIGDCVSYQSPWTTSGDWTEVPDEYIGIVVDIEIYGSADQCQILKSDNTIVMCPTSILKVISKVGEKK